MTPTQAILAAIKSPIPDLWQIAQIEELKGYTLGGKSAKELILECWHKAHELRKTNEELLEACKAITRELEYAYGGHGQMPTMEAKFYEQAKSAIAKAEGKE